ncbi:MAG: HAD family hydrolase [Bacteroidota bacterium]
MIKAVIFDFGNVICAFDPRIFIRSIAPYSALPKSEISERLKAGSDLFVGYETGAMTSQEFFSVMCSRLALTIRQNEFVRVFNSIFTPIPTTSALIRQLKGHYNIGLLSNTSEWHFERTIEQHETYPLFDTVTLSYRVGAMKPAEAIYHDALKKLKLPPESCVYIDDIKEYADVATRLGIHGIHYTSHEDLIRELQHLNVPVSQSL